MFGPSYIGCCQVQRGHQGRVGVGFLQLGCGSELCVLKVNQGPTSLRRLRREHPGPQDLAAGPGAAQQSQPVPAPRSAAAYIHAVWSAHRMEAISRSTAAGSRKGWLRMANRCLCTPPPPSAQGLPGNFQIPTCSAKTSRAPCCAASSTMKPELLAKVQMSPSFPV